MQGWTTFSDRGPHCSSLPSCLN